MGARHAGTGHRGRGTTRRGQSGDAILIVFRGGRCGGGPGLVRARNTGEFGGQAGDAFATHVLFDRDRMTRFDALGGASPRFFGDDPGDQLLAHESTQIGQGAGVLRRNEDAHGEGVLVGVGDLHAPGATVPQVGGSEELLNLGSDEGHGRGPVEFEFDGAQLGGGSARPVLEGGLREGAAGDDEAALVPDAYDHVGERDFLDGAGFVLVAGDDDVAHADRVSEGELQAGEHVAEGLLGGEADNHGDDTGGGQDGGHGVAGDLKSADDCDDADDDGDRLGESAQDLGLGLKATRTPLVGGLASLGGVLEDPRGGVRHPGQAGEGDDEQHVHEERRDRRAIPIGQVGVNERDAEARPRPPGREGEVARAAHARQDRRGRGRLREGLAQQGGKED